MRINAPKFNFSSLEPPLKMVRKLPDPPPDEPEKTEDGKEKKKTNLFKKKVRPMFFGVGEDGEESLHRFRKKDPDKFPWVLSDFKNVEFEGNLEGSQKANYVLFIIQTEDDSEHGPKAPVDGFRVKPVSKWYKFTAPPKYSTLTAEEAEAKMNDRKKQEDRWFMRNLKACIALPFIEIKEQLEGEEKMKQEELDELNRVMRQKAFKVSSGPRNRRGGGGDRDGLDEDIDFDEVMSDDENPDFGIENEDDAKEAKKREFGDLAKKRVFEDDSELEIKNKKGGSAVAKSIKKTLKKNEHDMYISDDEDNKNPYDSNEESDDEPDEILEVIGKDDVGKGLAVSATASVNESGKATPSGRGSPSLKPPGSGSSSKRASPNVTKGKKRDAEPVASGNALKRVKKEGGGSSPSLGTGGGSSGMGSSGSASPNLSGSGSPRIQGAGRSTPNVGGSGAAAARAPSPNVPGSGATSPSLGGTKIKMRVSSPDVGSQSGSPVPARASSPEIKKEDRKRKGHDGNSSPATGGETKKIKLKLGSSPDIPPPPPSSAEIMANHRKEEERRRMAAMAARKATSPTPSATSPKPSSSTPKPSGRASSSSTPSLPAPSSSGNSGDQNLLTDTDLIRAMSTQPIPQNVKDIVARLRDKIASDDRNKERLKEMMRRLCHSSNGVITLKGGLA
ncbi:hypothetical protein HDU97_002637 [Phlyctochytrium planicorne]|nr:hypothetical protein HDU97_002637 [Phlyctochytrium planicorne]